MKRLHGRQWLAMPVMYSSRCRAVRQPKRARSAGAHARDSYTPRRRQRASHHQWQLTPHCPRRRTAVRTASRSCSQRLHSHPHRARQQTACARPCSAAQMGRGRGCLLGWAGQRVAPAPPPPTRSTVLTPTAPGLGSPCAGCRQVYAGFAVASAIRAANARCRAPLVRDERCSAVSVPIEVAGLA